MTATLRALAVLMAAACAAPTADALSKNEEKALFAGTLLGVGLGTRALILRDLNPEAAPLDRRMFIAVHEGMRSPLLSGVVSVVNELGDGRVLLIGSLAAAEWGTPKGRRAGRFVFASVAAGSLASETLKRIIGRPRPLNPEDRRSMPSGHTTNAFAAAAGLSHEYPRWAPLFYGLAAGVGFSRIYLGRHYPSDTLGGALLGMSSARVVLRRDSAVLAFSF
ncbi:MAG: phosphatase PAP2 family protein [Candidatus Poribacteria bacterium]|nr:phosphatase PAP2 family protein [Candidatus Poribacteria bacterium]